MYNLVKRDSVDNIFGDAFRKMREKQGLSQRDLASALEYSSPQFISNWERGLSYPPKQTLKKVCELYKGFNYKALSQEICKREIIRLEQYWG